MNGDDRGATGVAETMENAAAGRPYVSIGEVLDALRPEFADLTISKIRFLESQGLLEPERTLSGYRKFYPADVARLRWILLQQGERYVPLKAIRAALAEAEASGAIPSGSAVGATRGGPAPTTAAAPRSRDRAEDAGEDAESGDDHDDRAEATHRGAPPAALGEARHPASRARAAAASSAALAANGAAVPPDRSAEGRSVTPSPMPSPRSREGQAPAAQPAATTASASTAAVPATSAAVLGSANPLLAAGTGASLTATELAAASGLAIEDIRLLEQFGLVVGRAVFAATYYDEDALLAAKAAAAFRAFGVEPRHLRMYRTAADREADFFAQIVSPLLHRRRAEGRAEAVQTLDELTRLGEQLRGVALRQVLRAALDAR